MESNRNATKQVIENPPVIENVKHLEVADQAYFPKYENLYPDEKSVSDMLTKQFGNTWIAYQVKTKLEIF